MKMPLEKTSRLQQVNDLHALPSLKTKFRHSITHSITFYSRKWRDPFKVWETTNYTVPKRPIFLFFE